MLAFLSLLCARLLGIEKYVVPAVFERNRSSLAAVAEMLRAVFINVQPLVATQTGCCTACTPEAAQAGS
jgi:hypothetical protein